METKSALHASMEDLAEAVVLLAHAVRRLTSRTPNGAATDAAKAAADRAEAVLVRYVTPPAPEATK